MSFAKQFILSLSNRSRRESRPLREAVAKRPRQRTSAFALESLETRVMMSATPMEVVQVPVSTPSVTAAVVTTNHADYAPGETAVITTSNTNGAGLKFSAGELVRFQVTRTDGMADSPNGTANGMPAGNDSWYVADGVGGFAAHQQFDANGQAIDRDANGQADWIAPDNDLTVNASISTAWHVEEQYLGASLQLMALGQASGAVATTAFTDAAANTNISVTSSAATTTYGGMVTFTAIVTDESGTAAPTGSVEFFDGATSLGAVSAVDSTGGTTSTWSFSTASLTAGTHASIHAVFTGTVGSFNDSTSVNIAQTVNKATATITVSGFTGVYDGAAHGATGTAVGVLGDSLPIPIWMGGGVLNVSTDGITNTAPYGNNGYRYINTLFSADQAAQVTLAEAPAAASGHQVFVFLRTQNPNTPSLNGYYIGYSEAGANGSWIVGRYINHDYLTTTNNASGTLLAAGDQIRASVVGNTVTASSYHGGIWTEEVSYTMTGADIVSGPGYIGLEISGNSPEVKLTNLIGGGYAGGMALGVLGESLSGLNLSGTAHTNAGSYTDTWTFTNANYENASGTVTSTIEKALATLSFGGETYLYDEEAVLGYKVTYDGAAHTAATGTAVGVLGESLSGLDLSGTTHTNAGTYTDTWTFTDATGNYWDTAGSIMDTIYKAKATVTVSGYTATYNGAAHTATGTAVGVLGESLSGLDLSGTIHTNAGTYTDTWTFTNANYKNISKTVHNSIA